MDRRDFLKLGALLPAAKSVIYSLFIAPQSYKDAVDRSNPIAYWPLNEVANEYTDAIARDVIYYDGGSCEGIFAPDPDRVGEFIEVGRTSPLLACACYPPDIWIQIGKCDESENLLDL